MKIFTTNSKVKNIKVKKIFCILSAVAIFTTATAQTKSPVLKKTILQPVRTNTFQPTETNTAIYTLTSAKISIKTGNDNKENPSTFLLYITENSGAWGDGRELFAQQNQYPTAELRTNSVSDIPLQKMPGTAADAFSLTNLQSKGLKFVITYSPNFFADAWKIEAVTITLEFKDQHGNIHSTTGGQTIQFNISNGLLTNTKRKMTGATDGFFIPKPVSITEK
jgi:hypothetical protein